MYVCTVMLYVVDLQYVCHVWSITYPSVSMQHEVCVCVCVRVCVSVSVDVVQTQTFLEGKVGGRSSNHVKRLTKTVAGPRFRVITQIRRCLLSQPLHLRLPHQHVEPAGKGHHSKCSKSIGRDGATIGRAMCLI